MSRAQGRGKWLGACGATLAALVMLMLTAAAHAGPGGAKHPTVARPSNAASATPASPAGTLKIPRLDFTDTKLENGLRVIIAPDHTAPVYAIDVAYNVGSRNERPGRTGFAHLFEHMMFEGSQNVGKGEHFTLILNNGGGMNGTTNEDRTTYFEELPKNQLDLGLYLEADRMPTRPISTISATPSRKSAASASTTSPTARPTSTSTISPTTLSPTSIRPSALCWT
jgi:zinc protease